MRTVWRDGDEDKRVAAPVSLIVSAAAAVDDVRLSLTPQLRTDCGDTLLILVDLGNGRQRLGASIFAQVTQQIGNEAPDVEQPEQLAAAIRALRALAAQAACWPITTAPTAGCLPRCARWPSPATAA